MNILKKLLISLNSVAYFLLSFSYASAALLDSGTKTKIKDQTNKFNAGAGFDSSASLPVVIQYIIQGFLSLLGIIFIVLILYAGYNWMTAMGEEEKVTKAKDTIQRAIIGLIIIVAAYGITYFIFKYLGGGSSGWGTTSP